MTTAAKASNILYLRYQPTRISKFFSQVIQQFLNGYCRSKPKVCKTNAAEVSKIALLYHQLCNINFNPQATLRTIPGLPSPM